MGDSWNYEGFDQLFDSPKGLLSPVQVSGNGTFDQAGRRSSGMVSVLFFEGSKLVDPSWICHGQIGMPWFLMGKSC